MVVAGKQTGGVTEEDEEGVRGQRSEAGLDGEREVRGFSELTQERSDTVCVCECVTYSRHGVLLSV